MPQIITDVALKRLDFFQWKGVAKALEEGDITSAKGVSPGGKTSSDNSPPTSRYAPRSDGGNREVGGEFDDGKHPIGDFIL